MERKESRILQPQDETLYATVQKKETHTKMKYLKSDKISKNKYELILEVTEHDMLMLEDLHHTLAPFQRYDELIEKTKSYGKAFDKEIDKIQNYIELSPKFKRFKDKLWKTFWRLWKEHDD